MTWHRAGIVLIGVSLVAAGVCEAKTDRPKGRISDWPTAVANAKKYNKIIFCIYAPGITRLYGTGKTEAATAGESTEWRVTAVICQPQVRKLEKQFYLVARLRTGDSTSNWSAFSSQTDGCCFVTANGEFLEAVGRDCTVAEFTEACKRAVARAKELRANQPPTATELASVAEEALKEEDYALALSNADEVLQGPEAATPAGKRADRVKKTILGRAQGGLTRAEDRLKEGKAVQAFREFDEVAHLFPMLDEGKRAAQRLEEAMADAAHAKASEEYASERVVYELLEQGNDLADNEDWAGAIAKLQQIVDNHKASPVLRRAAARLKECRDALEEEQAAAGCGNP